MIRSTMKPDISEIIADNQQEVTDANKRRPSAAATPSRAFSRPLRLRVLVSEMWSLERRCRLLDECSRELSFSEESDPSGLPVDESSREVLRVKAASRSSSKTMHRAGTRPMSVVSVLSLIHDDDSETT